MQPNDMYDGYTKYDTEFKDIQMDNNFLEEEVEYDISNF